MSQQPRAFGKYSFDPYAAFFIVMAAGVGSILLAFIGMLMIRDQMLWSYPFASLFSVVVVLNIGDGSATAKETFWVWIGGTVGFALLALVGYGILTLFGGVP